MIYNFGNCPFKEVKTKLELRLTFKMRLPFKKT